MMMKIQKTEKFCSTLFQWILTIPSAFIIELQCHVHFNSYLLRHAETGAKLPVPPKIASPSQPQRHAHNMKATCILREVSLQCYHYCYSIII